MSSHALDLVLAYAAGGMTVCLVLVVAASLRVRRLRREAGGEEAGDG